MGFYQDYELVGLVHEGPVKTLRAKEVATGRAVLLHLLTSAVDRDRQKSLLEKVEALAEDPPGGGFSPILRTGEFAGTRYIVTESFEPFSDFDNWLTTLTGGARTPSPDAIKPGPQPVAAASPQAQEVNPGFRRPAHQSMLESERAAQIAGQRAQPTAGPDVTTLVKEQTGTETAGGQKERSSDRAGTYADVPAAGSSREPRGLAAINLHQLAGPIDVKPSVADAPGAQESEIEGWLQTARRHLEGDATGRALEALDTVLRLRPDDTEALRLSAEVKRRQQLSRELAQARQEKERRFRNAREHWQRGDVSAALTELEALLSFESRHPDPDSGHTAEYEDFHQEVRAENDAIRRSYDEARAQLAKDDPDAALAICVRYLAKYPNHPLFQALKFEVGERKRQQLVSFISETDRRVESEPDLDRRVSILEEAHRSFPGETHFEECLRLAREKRDLVRSAVEKARTLEQGEHFHEALQQWQLVLSIYPQFPEIDDATKRLTERLEQQRQRRQALKRWMEEIQRDLRAGDYDQAVDLARDARAEYPADPELREIEKLALQARERGSHIKDLLRRAQKASEQGRHAEGLGLLRQAQEADPRNAAIRAELVQALTQLARNKIDSDWEAAEPLLEEALQLRPNESSAVGLLEQVAQRKREELVSWCLVQARRLKSEGDIPEALNVIKDGLKHYPDESRLRQLEKNLQLGRDTDFSETSSDVDFDQLRRLEQQMRQDSDEVRLDELVAQVRDIVERRPGNERIRGLATKLLRDASRGAPSPAAPGESASGKGREPAAAGAEHSAGRPGAFSDAGDHQDLEEARPPSAGSRARTPSAHRAPSRPRRPALSGPWEAAWSGRFSPEQASAHEDSEQRFEEPSAYPAHQEAPGYTVQTEDDLLSRLAAEGSGKAEPEPPAPSAPDPPSWKVQLGRLMAALRAWLNSEVQLPGMSRSWPLGAVALSIAGLVLVALLGALILWDLIQGPAANLRVRVVIQSSPAGATLSINDEVCGVSSCEVELAANNYRAEAHLAGYQPAAVSFDVDPEQPTDRDPIVLALTPLSALLRISSDLGDGKVTLDGEAVGELEDGAFELEMDGLTPGAHTLQVSSRGSTATINFAAVPGALPELLEPIGVRSVKAVVLAGLGRSAFLYSHSGKDTVSLDGASLGEVGEEGRAFNDLSPGAHELTLGEGRERRKLVFEGGDRPVLAAFLNTDRNVGALRIMTTEDDAAIYLNGAKYRRTTARGSRLIYLAPKEYLVRVEKQGFRPPPEQLVEVRKGEEVRLNFSLEPNPQTASLRIRYGLPGADVLVDDKVLGTVRADGTFTAPNLAPGRHKVLLRMELYKSKQVEHDFVAGETFELAGVLESAVGTLRIRITPEAPGLELTLRREGEEGAQRISDRTLHLPPGTYTVNATAPGFQEGSTTVEIEVSRTKTAALTLAAVERIKKVRPSFSLDDWAKNGGWERDGDLLVRRGGNFVLAPQASGTGTYSFSASLQKGRRLEWVLDYVDENNYVLYQLGKNYFHRTEVKAGKKSKTVKIPHSVAWDDLLNVQIEVTPDAIVHKLLRGGQWTVSDRWSRSGAADGKFGFHVPGRDQIGLHQFSFEPSS